MTTITRLPDRPLSHADLAALDTDRLTVAPYGGIPQGDDVRVYAVKIATDDAAHALGFDDSQGQWRHLAAVETADLATADSQLDAVLDEWVQEEYGGQFEVLKTVR